MTGAIGITLLAALAAALVLGTVAVRLRMPPMVGYILAGFLVSPFTPGFVADDEQVTALADVGVALLMFSIGLRFSLRQLFAVGRYVVVGASVQMAAVIALGAGLGVFLGWTWLEALFLGSIAAVSSSVVLIKIAGDAGAQDTPHGRIAFAWSVVQDLMTVGLLVLLSAFAGSGDNPVRDVVLTSLVAIIFLAIIAFGGQRTFPIALAMLARLGPREFFVVGAAVLAIGSAFGATQLGVSLALGAFVAGVALADSDLTTNLLSETFGLRELFAAVFFVSVGMLLDPLALFANPALVLLVAGLIVIVKGAVVFTTARLLKTPPASAVLMAALLAQAGEFSFLLAVLGLDADVIAADTFGVLLGAVIISIFAAVPIVGLATRVAARLPGPTERHPGMPERPEPLRRHAIIAGWGRSARQLGRYLDNRGFRYIAIDGSYPVVETARSAGTNILYGDAGSAVVLEEAGIRTARILILAIRDPLAVHQAVEYARGVNPRLSIIARASDDEQVEDLRRHGVTAFVVERQLGRAAAILVLDRFGVPPAEVRALLARLSVDGRAPSA